jgi:hypothetical protein
MTIADVLELAPTVLPRPVKPFPAETTASYLARLAYANRLDPQALRRYITGSRLSRPLPVQRLAAVSGMPVPALRHAIANLDDDKPAITYYYRSIAIHPQVSGPACQLCILARGATQPVTCWKRPEETVCRRHRRWTGSGSAALQPSLDPQPDILKAHRQHLRLIRRFGREETTLGFTIARQICRQWHDQREHDEEFNRRLGIFHGLDWRLPPGHPTVEAAAYPQVVALTRILASPHWKSNAIDFTPGGRSLFAQEIRRTVAPTYRWPQPSFSKDPLHRWIVGGRHRSPYDISAEVVA